MDWLTFALFFLTCCVAASTGALFPPNEWYKNLDKPSWNPPNWLFPIAWSILYIVIAYVGMRISNIAGSKNFLIAFVDKLLSLCLQIHNHQLSKLIYFFSSNKYFLIHKIIK